MNNNEYLAHHGIKNQKWGVKHGPPYPVERGSGGKPKTTNIIKSRLKGAIQKRKENYAEKKVENAEERHKRLREDVVKDPKKITKYKKEFSRQELEDMIKEIQFNRKLEDIRFEEIKRGRERFESFKKSVGNIKDFATTTKDMYNLAADINNMLVDAGKSKGNKWTRIGGDQNQKKQEKQN